MDHLEFCLGTILTVQQQLLTEKVWMLKGH